MRYILDHDMHIHSHLSPCSADPAQTTQAILDYGIKAGYKHIVLTDHFWDEDVPCATDRLGADNDAGNTYGVDPMILLKWAGFKNINKALPLPQADGIKFHFGCEADMDKYSVVGINQKNFDKFDFIIVPINHLHCPWAKLQSKLDLKEQAVILAQRFWNLTQLDLPFHKVGLAHITWDGLAACSPNWNDHLEILNYIPDERWRLLFAETAKKGMGVELNVDIDLYAEGYERETMLRPYRIAKECGCKFYFGSDAHHPYEFELLKKRADFFIDRLCLTEDDKFNPFD